MSLSRLATFSIGLVLALGGLYFLFTSPFDLLHLAISLILVIVGVFILAGGVPTL